MFFRKAANEPQCLMIKFYFIDLVKLLQPRPSPKMCIGPPGIGQMVSPALDRSNGPKVWGNCSAHYPEFLLISCCCNFSNCMFDISCLTQHTWEACRKFYCTSHPNDKIKTNSENRGDVYTIGPLLHLLSFSKKVLSYNPSLGSFCKMSACFTSACLASL